MEAMTNAFVPSMDELIAAAGMTCFAEDCDVVVMKRSPRVIEPFKPASAVAPPFSD